MSERISEFRPADTPEEDIDAKWDAWFDQQEKNGYAVISRDEWREKLDEAASIGYADGRDDERKELEAKRAPLVDDVMALADIFADWSNTDGREGYTSKYTDRARANLLAAIEALARSAK